MFYPPVKIIWIVSNNLCFSISKRFCCSKGVRVRFAPSPTGFLHLGGLRTALYNDLFAKSHNGTTILRIEDTDKSRKVESASEKLIEDLAWCGITFDEGPHFQSDRLDIYKKYVEELLIEGKAYYCFCSKLRLDMIRKEALKMREIPKYDNNCRSLSKEEIKKKLDGGELPCVRFKFDDNSSESVEDLIYTATKDSDYNEGDFIIMKADGFPTYHFANVIDDHLMNISHVLRGVEWQISTIKHIMLYRAFNWTPPKFGHFPLLLNIDGSKLSKRHGDINIQSLKRNGYFPNAILSLLAGIGGGFKIEPSLRDSRVFTYDELVQQFDISKVGTSSSKINLEKLAYYNGLELRRKLSNENECDEMVKKVQNLIAKHLDQCENQMKPKSDPEYIRSILLKFKCRINRLEDLFSNEYISLWTDRCTVILSNSGDLKIAEKLLLEIRTIEWNEESCKKFLKAFAVTNNLPYSKLMKLIRSMILQNRDGPSIYELFEIFGKENIQSRLEAVISESKSKNPMTNTGA